MVSFKELSFESLIFLKKRKEAIPTIFFIILKFAEIFWEELRKQHRGDGEKVGLEDTKPNGLTDSQPVSHLVHQLCWCFENISWNFQGFFRKARVFVHAGETVATQCEFHIWSIAPGRQESGSSAGVSRILWCNCWSLPQLGPALTQSRLSKHKADAIHIYSSTRVIILRKRIQYQHQYKLFVKISGWWSVMIGSFLLFGELFPFFSLERWIV